ncbi:unnamed protein product [Dicrocoelium dendriticum]|nr:unnamed protein product [Dicrocoelium dendriticum]
MTSLIGRPNRGLFNVTFNDIGEIVIISKFVRRLREFFSIIYERNIYQRGPVASSVELLRVSGEGTEQATIQFDVEISEKGWPDDWDSFYGNSGVLKSVERSLCSEVSLLQLNIAYARSLKILKLDK